MKSSFPRLHVQLPTCSYGPQARTSTHTGLRSTSSYPSATFMTLMPTSLDDARAAQTEGWTSTSLLLLHSTSM